MKTSKCTEEQIAYVLRPVAGGSPIDDMCRQMGVSKTTLLDLGKQLRPPGRGGAQAAALAGG